MTQQDFPLVTFDVLWHQGSLDPADKGCHGESHEGHGLSVSTDPEAWEEIARLGGLPLWQLSKLDNRMLDFHALDSAQKQRIANWALENGYVELAQAWEWTRYDCELEQDVTSLSSTMKDALWEAGFEEASEATEDAAVPESVPDDAKDFVRRVDTLVPTEQLCGQLRVSRPGEPTVLIEDWMAIVFAEEVLGIDGVWWNDNLDAATLSAPRGVIFPDRVPEWTIRKADEAPLP